MDTRNNSVAFSQHSRIGSTMFPKINGKRRGFLSALKGLMREGSLQRNSTITLEGNVKLHGIHADIIFPLSSQDIVDFNDDTSPTSQHSQSSPEPSRKPRTIFQTRNREILPSESIHEFPGKLAYNVTVLANLKRRILSRFRLIHLTESLDHVHPLIIAGEWIGHGVQKHVGVSMLTTRFVILAISINSQWQNDADFADIQEPDAHIYNLLAWVPKYEIRFWLGNMTEHNPAFEQMQNIADDIEKACPFAAACGVNGSQGEGIVWKIGTRTGRSKVSKWFKMKGPISMGLLPQPETQAARALNLLSHRSYTGAPDRAQRQNSSIGAGNHQEKRDHRINGLQFAVKSPRQPNTDGMDLLAKHFITDRRIEQAFEYLIEMNKNPFNGCNTEAQGVFVNWIVDDIFKEETLELGELCLKNKSQYNAKKKVGFKYDVRLKERIERIARRRYAEELSAKSAMYRAMFERALSFKSHGEAVETQEDIDGSDQESNFRTTSLESSDYGSQESETASDDDLQLSEELRRNDNEEGASLKYEDKKLIQVDVDRDKERSLKPEADAKSTLRRSDMKRAWSREQWVIAVKEDDMSRHQERLQRLCVL